MQYAALIGGGRPVEQRDGEGLARWAHGHCLDHCRGQKDEFVHRGITNRRRRRRRRRRRSLVLELPSERPTATVMGGRLGL